MSSTSALLKSASSLQSKIAEQEEAQVAFDYSQSAKTYADFQLYSNFINQRMQTAAGDPSKTLSLQKALATARSGYISNEIQRQTLDVLEGRSDDRTKYGKMVDLFYQAIDAGSYDLAQSLNLQLDNLSIKIQNEDEAKANAAQRAYGAMAATQSKTLGDFVDKLKNGNDIVELPHAVELPDGSKVTQVKPFNVLAHDLKATGTSESGDFFREAYATGAAITQALVDAYNGAADQEAADKIWNNDTYRNILNGEAGFDIGGMKLNLNELQLAYQSNDANNPIYNLSTARNEATGQIEYKLKKNNVDDLTWIRDDQGNYMQVATRTSYDKVPYQQLDTKLTDNGEVISSSKNDKGNYDINNGTGSVKETDGQSIGDRLANLGIQAKDGPEGKILISLPGDSAGSREATVGPDGSIRYNGSDGQLYEISLFNKDNFYSDGSGVRAGESRVVAPDEISIFGTDSPFGGKLSKASREGQAFVDELGHPIMHMDQFSPVDKITSTYQNATARGQAAGISAFQGGINTSQVLQGAQFTSAKLQADNQARLQAANQAALQSNVGVNLNQMPVQQWASNGAPIKQLTVAKPAPTPRVTVAAPAPTPKISSVGVATNVGKISGVSVAPTQPRVVVR